MPDKNQGTLIIIGGHEDREGEMVILREVARRARGGKVVIATVASQEPDDLFQTYDKAFRKLGVKEVAELAVAEREEAKQEEAVHTLDGATAVFFTGGDQLKITSQIGDTPTFQRIQQIYREGGVIAGTSAGASVLSDTMLVSGDGEKSATVGETVQMAPGLEFVRGVLIDQHFAERGRMGRLLGAVAQNPKTVGLGIDEDTAIVVNDGLYFDVIGSGGVYVIDGETISGSNIAEGSAGDNLSIHDVKLHVLSAGDRFDLHTRRPGRPEAERNGEKTRGKRAKKHAHAG
jgi:cyanophycinase